MKQYLVTRQFISGFLKGLEYTEKTPIAYAVGWTCHSPIGGSPYVIMRVIEL